MKLKPTLTSKSLKVATARDFSGGLNYTDSEFNLASKYAVSGYNMVPDDNGSLSVRWGTRLHVNTFSANRIVALDYFYKYLIAVHADGTITATDAAGTVTQVWNTAVAVSLPGQPSAWKATTQATFAQFLGGLIVANGTDKPILITTSLTAQYLQDLGSGSNINTPICKYVIIHSNYVVMAGDANAPGKLYISNVGTSGTWIGDPAPNDAITFDVYKYTSDSLGEITGLASFRGRLIVFFSEYIVTVKLGSYSSASTPVHTPAVDDIIESFGAVSHRGIINTGDSLFFLDFTGISQVRQATLTTQLTPTRVSTLIDNKLQRAMATLPKATLQQGAYAVYDKRESRLFWVIPSSADTNPANIARVFVLCKFSSKYAWTEYTGWNFQAGAVTTEGRLFFASSRYIYRHGSAYEPVLSDYEGVVAYNGTAQDKNPVYVNDVYCDTSQLGQGIPFYWELPQNILGDRVLWKSLHYITSDTQGASRFTAQFYLDDLKKRPATRGTPWSDATYFSDGAGWADQSMYAPDSTIEFTGGDRGALNTTVTTVSSGYRPTDNMGLYAVYGRFRFFKLALTGTSWSHLRIVSISLYYQTGNIY